MLLRGKHARLASKDLASFGESLDLGVVTGSGECGDSIWKLFGRLDRPNDIDRVVGFFTIASPMEAQISEQIEWLEKQLDDLLQGKELTSQSESAPKAVPRVSSAKRPVSSAPQSGKAERGTLRPAVVEILKKNEKPLKTADIYDALVTKGYQFTFKEPKKVLGIRLYKMLGVQVLGGGLFKAK